MLIPAVIWMYVSGQYLMGTVLLVVTIIAIVIDNLLRPMLIKKEANLPMLLVLVGCAGRLGGLRVGWAVHRAGGARGELYAAASLDRGG